MSDLSLTFEDFDETLVPDQRGCFSLVPNLETAAFVRNLTDNPEDSGFPKHRFTSLVPERPSAKIPVSQRDLTLEDLPKMRDSPTILPERYLYTQSMPVCKEELTDFEKDCEQVIMSSEAGRRVSEKLIAEKYLALIRKEVMESDKEEEEEVTTPTADKTMNWEDLTDFKTL